jgi:endonuclease/exonuclease/phosphatase (EEP) superfamily protein YafD
MFRAISLCAVGARFSLALYLLLRACFGPTLWPLCIVEPLLFWACLPSFAFLLVALVFRRRVAAFAHAVIVAAWLSLFGHVLVPPSEPTPARGPTLVLLSFNVGAGLATYGEIVKLLRDENADVVLIQELTGDQERALANDLLDLYPHRDLHGLGIDGLGVLSKFPLVERELFRLSSPRPYQRVVLDVRGERMTIFHVHPGLFRLLCGPWSSDAGDFERLAGAAQGLSPALIAGDLNATENMDPCVILERAGLRDAFREAGRGLGLTFPVPGRYRGLPLPPFVRIDFVWHTEAFRCRDARVLPAAGSDHFPLRVTLER